VAVQVESSDGVQVAVHEFGGSGRPLLFSHATGFHAHCYQPIAERLSDSFTSFGHDHRGHGATPRPDDWQVDWDRYGDDALAAAEAIAPDGGLIGFGHSMGGASLVMAARLNPGLFDVIVAFEPIIFPQMMGRPGDDPSPMVTGARNRRDTFDSYEAAMDNYASKPPMQFFDSEILRLYVEHGFAPVDRLEDGSEVAGEGQRPGRADGVTLRCAPEHEARTFEIGATHDLFDLLSEIETRVIVVSGKVETERSPAGIAERVAERLPNGTFIELEAGNHLSPFIDPDESAQLILDAI
jgi:pimeloyl-ACP methyl ester carboxylesterase